MSSSVSIVAPSSVAAIQPVPVGRVQVAGQVRADLCDQVDGCRGRRGQASTPGMVATRRGCTFLSTACAAGRTGSRAFCSYALNYSSFRVVFYGWFG